MFARASAVLFLFALAACRTTGDEGSAVMPDPAAGPGELRARCEPGGSVEGFDPCGTKQRVSLVFSGRSAHRNTKAKQDIPCTLDKPSSPSPMTTVVATCFRDETLYASAECTMCRIPGAGWNAVALLDELTDEQARMLQSRMGIMGEEPLHGEKAWKAALALREKHALL